MMLPTIGIHLRRQRARELIGIVLKHNDLLLIAGHGIKQHNAAADDFGGVG